MTLAVSFVATAGTAAGGQTGETQPVASPEEVVQDDEALRLDGVIVAQNPADSIALVRRAGAFRARPIRIGQEHAGHVLVDVGRDSVLLEGPEGSLRLFLSGARELTPTSGAASERGRAEETRRSLERDAWVRRSFPRAASRRRLDREIGVILSETRLEPNVENGEAHGLRLSRLPDGTLLSESGLLPGDVLLSLNGRALADLDALWETLAHLDGEDELRLVVDRRGEVLRLAYDLTN